MNDEGGAKLMGEVIQIDEARIKSHLGQMVRGTVEEAVNAMLKAEADRFCGASRYERTEADVTMRTASLNQPMYRSLRHAREVLAAWRDDQSRDVAH